MDQRNFDPHRRPCGGCSLSAQAKYPPIHTLLYVLDGERKVAAEVHEHMGTTVRLHRAGGDGRGYRAGWSWKAPGSPITIPVGPEMLGRAIDVLGRPIDGKGPPETAQSMPIPPQIAVLCAAAACRHDF